MEFVSANELNSVMKQLWNRIADDEQMSEKLLQSRLIVRFEYSQPDAQLTVDASDGKELRVYVGECELQPDVKMSMKADVANEFWLGRLNVPAAFLSGRIQSRGPVQQALALLPAISPARSIYPGVVKTVKSQAA